MKIHKSKKKQRDKLSNRFPVFFFFLCQPTACFYNTDIEEWVNLIGSDI